MLVYDRFSHPSLGNLALPSGSVSARIGRRRMTIGMSRRIQKSQSSSSRFQVVFFRKHFGQR
jgi:hypothetical protein